jgi:hypothetical protein
MNNYRKILIFMVLIPSLCSATVKAPKDLPSINEMVNHFRDLFSTKIKEISKNHVLVRNTGIWRFQTTQGIQCDWAWVDAHNEATKIEYTHALNGKTLVENIYYYDCYKSVNIHETIETKGIGIKALDSAAITSAIRSFDLIEDPEKNIFETFKKYSITNFNGNELFKVVVQKHKTDKIARFSFGNQLFLKIHYEYGNDVTKISYTTYPYDFIYKRFFSSWRSSGGGLTTATVLAYKTPEGKAIYRNDAGFLLTINEFQQYLSDNVYEGPLNTVKDIIKSHISNFPTTSFKTSGIKNSRVLDELELARIQLLTPNEANINEVKNLILDLITSITDDRLKLSGTRDEK